jgi:hypothetical protein
MTSLEQWGPGPKRYEIANELQSLLVELQPDMFYNNDGNDRVDHLVEYRSRLLHTKIFYSYPLVLTGKSHLLHHHRDFQQDQVPTQRGFHDYAGGHHSLVELVQRHLLPKDGALLAVDEPEVTYFYSLKSSSSTHLENNLKRYQAD